ncbi:uncharacterized protein si:dkey-175m17.7 [Lampris incognitus]|nr:uncharacterized protein si:dkey-175m17.7 [Lampris incognitus]
MPPLPLDERIVVIQHPKNLALCEGSPQTIPQPPSQIPTIANGQIPHPPHLHHPQSYPYSPSCNLLTLECKRRSSRQQKFKGDQAVVPVGVRQIPSHCHSNGTVTLTPRLPSHTHTIDIKVSLDKSVKAGGSSNSLRHSSSIKSGRRKHISLHLDQGLGERKYGTTGRPTGADQNSQKSPHHSQLSANPGGNLQFVPAYSQQCKARREREKERAGVTASFVPRSDQELPSVGNRKNSKLGTVHQNHNPHNPPCYHNAVPVPHASILNSNYPSTPLSHPTHAPSSFQQLNQSHASRSRDHRPHILHGLPLSPCSSHGGAFPSPDHTCTIDFSHPFNCGCWKLVRCGACKGHSTSRQGGGGSPSSSFSCVHTVGAVNGGAKTMGLKTLGGCLSTVSTSNTSSSNSTVSDCRANPFKPLSCASCSGEAGAFESPAIFRKKLVGGCLPCTPLSSSAPLRALQSCVTGCSPKASQTGSSTCSYCSSDPIVVTFNPRRGKHPGRSIGAAHPMAVFPPDDDDYSVRTIWPEELAKKINHSKAQKNHCAGLGIGVGKTCVSKDQNSSNGAGLVLLDCQNLQQFTQSQLTDHAGRRRLRQGKTAALDFIGSGSGSRRDEGQNSLKRLLHREMGMGDSTEQDGDLAYPSSPSPRSPSPPSPISFSPPPSAHNTLIKPKPKQRDREGGHSLPSAQSLHLVLNSLNREQDEENSRVHLSLPLSSSLPASLSDESMMTPDAENAVVSPILPFLFLGNERDAQDLDLLLHLNIGYVVNVTTHLPLYHVNSGLVRYKRLPATDNSKQNLRQYFEEVFEFIEEAHQSGKGVLVHCQAGVSRSATIVIAYLMKHTLMTMTDAYKYVRSRRPVVSPNLNFMGQLLEFERDLNSGVTPRILMPKLSGLETQLYMQVRSSSIQEMEACWDAEELHPNSINLNAADFNTTNWVAAESEWLMPRGTRPVCRVRNPALGKEETVDERKGGEVDGKKRQRREKRGRDCICRRIQNGMKGDTPVNSTMSVGQARKLVEQLKIEASFCRIKVSKAAADLMAYCDAHACEDPLITPVPTSENPFREKKFFCALL